LVALLAPCLAVHTEMLAYHAMGRKRRRRVKQSLMPTSHYLKTSGLYLPGFRAIVRGDVPLTAVAEPDNQETVFRRQQRFQFPVEPLHLTYCEAATKDAVLQTPPVPV
jgi:hypothetical protein